MVHSMVLSYHSGNALIQYFVVDKHTRHACDVFISKSFLQGIFCITANNGLCLTAVCLVSQEFTAMPKVKHFELNIYVQYLQTLVNSM